MTQLSIQELAPRFIVPTAIEGRRIRPIIHQHNSLFYL